MEFPSLHAQRLVRVGILSGLVSAAACGDRAPLAPARSAAARASLAQVGSDRSVGAVFVATNAAAGNAVIAFHRAANGALTPAGQFTTGGLGIGGTADPLASQFALTLSPDNRFLFAVNAGSNDVSVFRVTGHGLELIDRKPSGGTRPVSVAASAHTLYTLNAGSNAIGIFERQSDGTLVARGTRTLGAGAAGAAAIRLSRDGQLLTVTETGSNTIDGFVVDGQGSLGAPVTTTSTGDGPFGFDYASGGELVVSDAGSAAATSYTQSRDGRVSLATGPVSTNGQNAPCWVIVTGDGKFAYVANAGSSSISGFAVGRHGGLSLLTPNGRTGDLGTGAQPLDLDLSRDSRFLYVLENGTGRVGAFAVQADGSLTRLEDTPGLLANSGFMGLAAF